MHFDHGKKQNSDFQFLAFSIGYVGDLRWRWGLKTNFKIFLKGIFVQEESSETCFDHGQFEIKTFPIYAPPYCRTEVLFSSPLLNLHLNMLKVFTKLHDSVSRIQNFPASDHVWGSNIPLKHLHSKAKNWGSFSDKSHKNRGHLGTFFPADMGSLSEQFPKFWTVWKKQDFGWQFFGKNRGFWQM